MGAGREWCPCSSPGEGSWGSGVRQLSEVDGTEEGGRLQHRGWGLAAKRSVEGLWARLAPGSSRGSSAPPGRAPMSWLLARGAEVSSPNPSCLCRAREY